MIAFLTPAVHPIELLDTYTQRISRSDPASAESVVR